MTKIETWVSYLSRKHNSLLSELRRMNILIQVIQDFLPSTSCRILELGCGSAITSFALAEYGYSTCCVDNDATVLDWVRNKYPFFMQYLSFCEADMHSLPFAPLSFDLVFSQGLLEHFEDECIIESLCEQNRVAQMVVFDVPNARHGRDSLRGDERLLPINHYYRLCEQARLKVCCLYGRRWIRPLSILPEELLYLQPSLSRLCAQSSIFVCRSR